MKISDARGWYRGYLLSAGIAIVIASGSFVAYRNHSFAAQELQRARDAVTAVADGSPTPSHALAAGVVSAAEPSAKYPFLSRRKLADGRALGGPDAAETDKLLYDAANEADAEGAFARFLDNGSGLIVAARPLSRGNVAAVVVEPPHGPERFPFLTLLGMFTLGAGLCFAGALKGGWMRQASLAVGPLSFVIPAAVWGGVWPASIIALVALTVALLERSGAIAKAAAEARTNRVAYTFLAPAGLAMLMLVLIPFGVGLLLGFYDHAHGEWRFVGFSNFVDILSGGGRSFTDPLNFWFTLGVTVAWTFGNVVLHVTIGVAFALVLRQSWLRGKGIYRVLLILPWAIPNYITALIWRGMFQSEYGAVNAILDVLGLDKVGWFSSWATAFTANVTTNTWLGFPFMMVVALGALESIPRDMYEAAEVDGATSWQRFFHITLPQLRPALLPAIVLGSIWTFNMFNVIYLVSEGAPAGGTDILVTEAYRWAFERGERYGMAAAYATLIFLILLVWTVFGSRINKKEDPA